MSITNKGQRILRLLCQSSSSAFLFVCGWCCGWSIPSAFLLLFLSFSSQLNFCVHSYPTPTPSSNSIITTNTNPPTPPLNSKEVPVRDLHVDPKIVIPLTVSAVFFILLLIFAMGFLSWLFRIKKLRRRSTNQVGVVDQNTKDDNDCSVKIYSWDDIERFTDNFSQVIGSGGFSNVYLARLPDSNHGAVKIHVGSDRLNEVSKQELDFLLRLAHPNIIKLFGYSDDRGALVFEYVPNGTLQDKLHGRREENETILPWRSRLAIAFQLAQAIEYLHEKCTLHIVHGDIKASNILLDAHLNCKLCDFGSAKMGFSSAVMPPSCSSPSPSPSPSPYRVKQLMIGSPGYTDPHYLRTGIASKKNDVYSFGVIILELVMGMEAFCPERGQLLTSIAAPLLKDVTECEAIKITEMVDPRLAGDFDLEEARAMLSISVLCLRQSPILRPSATQILQTTKDKISSVYFLYSSQKDSISPNSKAIMQEKI